MRQKQKQMMDRWPPELREHHMRELEKIKKAGRLPTIALVVSIVAFAINVISTLLK